MYDKSPNYKQLAKEITSRTEKSAVGLLDEKHSLLIKAKKHLKIRGHSENK